MTNRLLFFTGLTGVVVYLTSCSKASEDMLMPQQCDTVDMKYSTDILPIITSNCYRCHGNGNVTNGVDLDGYANLKVRAANGDLTGVITHAAGYPPMPGDGGKLSDCEINKIKAWISRGTPDN